MVFGTLAVTILCFCFFENCRVLGDSLWRCRGYVCQSHGLFQPHHMDRQTDRLVETSFWASCSPLFSDTHVWRYFAHLNANVFEEFRSARCRLHFFLERTHSFSDLIFKNQSVLFSVKMTQVSGSLKTWDLLACLKGLFCFTSIQLALCLPAETMCGPAAVSPWRLSAELTNRFQRDNKQPRSSAEARRLRLGSSSNQGSRNPSMSRRDGYKKKKKKVFNLDFYVHYVRQTVCLCKY